MIKITGKKARPWFQGLLMLVALVYFGDKLSEGRADYQAMLGHFDGALFAFSGLILAAVFPLLPVASKLTAELFQVKLSMRLSFQSYFYSQAGKYLPGGIWAYVGRVYLFHQSGIHKRTGFAITLMELLFLCLSGAFCFLISVYFWKQLPVFLLWLSIACLLAFTLCTLLPFSKTFRAAMLSRFDLDLAFKPGKLCLILLIYVCFWEGVGLGFYYLTQAMTPVPANMVLILAGIYPLAWIMGKLVFFMPAGIGVREGALVYLLGFFLSDNQSIWVSVVSRLWWIAAEALCAAIVLGWSWFYPGTQETLSKLESQSKQGSQSKQRSQGKQ